MSEFNDDTPGRKAIEVMEKVHKEIVFKTPIGAPKAKRKKKILDEETYVEEIGNIIQRDFFPDLEKIKAQNAYLDAIERNDVAKLRELYTKYSGKRPPTERMPSPATFETPANIHNTQQETIELENENNNKTENEKQQIKRLSLDQYLNSHTSQDNESFEEIIETTEKRHRENYAYLYGEESKTEEDRQKLIALPSIEKQASLPQKPCCVETWGYKNKNYLMYNPDGVELTPEQEMELNKNRQEIIYENTKLKLNPFNEIRSKETITELAKSQAKVLDGKIGVDGKELLKSDTPKVGGFSFVRSPSPSPSILGSPLMTWGEIEGTPFRLDGSDTPLPRSQGPSFKMSEPPRREQLALALAEKVGEKHRDTKRKALDAQRRKLTEPSPRPNTSSLDRLATMSPAARRLASSHLKLDLNFISSPSMTGRLKSPLLARSPTPKRHTTPKLNLGIKKVDQSAESKEVSTDDLLNISLPSRKRASDFF